MENTPPSPPDAPPSHRRVRFLRLLPWIAYGVGIPLVAVLYAVFVHVGCPDVLRGILTRIPVETLRSWFGTGLAWFRESREWLLSLVVIVGLGGIVFSLAVLGFLKAFKKVGHGFAATLLLFVAGLSLYGSPAVLKPAAIHGPGGWNLFAEGIVRFDNALGGFFPSRISYADISPESPPAVSLAPPAAPDLSPDAADTPPSDGENGGSPSDRSPAATPSVHIVILFYGFHLLCYAYTIALVSTFFSRRLANAVLMVGVALLDAVLGSLFRRRRPLRVFWGDGKEAYTAATGGASPRTHTVFLVPHKVPFALRLKPDPVTDRLNSDGRIRWTYASPENPGKTMAWFLSRASEHFFLGEDGRKNVIHANGLLSFLENYHARRHLRPGCRTPVIHVRIDAESEEDSFFRWADRWNSHSAGHANATSWHPSIQVVREPTLAAANLLWNHPMHDVPGITLSRPGAPSGAINLLLVGYGAHGKALLRDMLQDAQLPGVSFRATVVDRDAGSFTDLMANVSSGIREGYGIECQLLNAFSGAFRDLLPQDGAAPSPDASPSPPLWNRIVLAMENDLDNIRLALRIEEHYRRWGLFEKLGSDGPRVIFARVRDPDNREYTEAFRPRSGPAADSSLLPVSTFGNLDGIYGRESFPGPSIENAAKFLNWIYVVAGKDEKKKQEQDNPSAYPLATLPPDAETAWQKATSFDRESSRAAVFGLRNLAWLLGYAPAAGRLPGGAASRRHTPLEAAVGALGGCPELETALAEAEHLRWNAFHFLRGIRAWDFDPDGLKADARQIADRVRASGKQPEPNEGVRENQIKPRCRHAALVPFDQLDAVAAAFDEANALAGLPRRSRIARADHDLVQWMPLILAKTDWIFPGDP